MVPRGTTAACHAGRREGPVATTRILPVRAAPTSGAAPCAACCCGGSNDELQLWQLLPPRPAPPMVPLSMSQARMVSIHSTLLAAGISW